MRLDSGQYQWPLRKEGAERIRRQYSRGKISQVRLAWPIRRRGSLTEFGKWSGADWGKVEENLASETNSVGEKEKAKRVAASVISRELAATQPAAPMKKKRLFTNFYPVNALKYEWRNVGIFCFCFSFWTLDYRLIVQRGRKFENPSTELESSSFAHCLSDSG